MKKIIAAVLAIVMVMGIATAAFADEGEEMIEAVAVETVEEVAEETEEVEEVEETIEEVAEITEEVAEITEEAEEITEEVEEAVEETEEVTEVVTATAYARISCDHHNESVDEGTVITLTADVSDIEGEIVSITWQYTADNGVTVNTLPETGRTLTFTANEETAGYLFRAIVTYTVVA